MRRTWLVAFSLPIILLLTQSICGGEKAAEQPTIVVRIKSLNALLDNLNLVVKLVGQEDAAHQIEAVIKSKVGKKGINGIDPARPIGAYARFGREIDDLYGAVLIPVADEKAVLSLLDNFGLVYKKGKDGVYTYRTPTNVDVYFRFAHQYLYITSISTKSIQTKNLIDPAKALAMTGEATISFRARIDQIPIDTKTLALTQLETTVDAIKKNGPTNETKTQEAFRLALLDDIHGMARSVLRDAAELRFDLDVSDKSKELSANFSIVGKPGSELAKSVHTLGNLKSPLALVTGKDLAFHGALHVAVPKELHKAFAAVIDEAVAKSLEGIQSVAKRQQAETLFKALMPTAKADEYQVVAAVLGPKADRYTFVGAIKLKDGVKLGATVHDLISDALKQIPEAERKKVHLDFDRVGAVAIHKFETPKNPVLDPLIADVGGDKYLYLAFRDDALFLAIGADALPVLKASLAKTDSTASPPLLFDLDVARMAKWLARTPKQKEQADKLRAAGENSRIHLSIAGGTRLHAHVQMPFSVLEFLVKLSEK